MALIAIHDLHFRYENGFSALNGLDLDIAQGEIFGFLGPNGAGKTTTFKVLVGLLEPTQGQALINGRQIGHQEREVYHTVGFMPDLTDLYDDFTVNEFLRFFGLCHGMSEPQLNARMDELLTRFRLTEKRVELMGTLSKGQKQKACIMRTMIHDPAILLLDEPASGLDPFSRSLLHNVLREEQQRGKTIMISSHILPELADLCTTVGIMYQGRLVEQGRVGELLAKYQNPAATYKLRIIERLELAQQVLHRLDDLQGIRQLSAETLLIEYNGDPQQVANLIEMLVKSGVRITGFEKVNKDIQTIYNEILNE
jgi:ABC-2 type transport system ATP-binding protein